LYDDREKRFPLLGKTGVGFFGRKEAQGLWGCGRVSIAPIGVGEILFEAPSNPAPFCGQEFQDRIR
jgi:hypothetical protein